MRLRVAEGGWEIWCPVCEEVHLLPGPGRGWTFDGNDERPTFTPSFRITTGPPRARQVCHFNLTEGSLLYHADTTRGGARRLPLPELP